MILQCEVYIRVAQLYFTSKVITNKSQVGCVSTEQNSIGFLPMGITRGAEVGRGGGNLPSLTMSQDVIEWLGVSMSALP